jgi:abequosyltransferase
MAPMKTKPILSICIPTYNRSNYLKNCLESLVTQPAFALGEIEVVVSDNFSTDNTYEVVAGFIQRYANIHYFKNAENIRDMNFPKVISLASGLYRKLCNDSIIFKDGTMEYMLRLIKNNIVDQPVLFFINTDPIRKFEEIEAKYLLEDFLNTVSFNITWIGAFGLWEKDCDHIDINTGGCELHLWQVRYLLEILAREKKSIIVHRQLFRTQFIEKKDISYGLYNVFYLNLLGLLSLYIQNKSLSLKCYAKIERDLLYKFFLRYLIQYELYKSEYIFSSTENFPKVLVETYKDRRYYVHFQIVHQFILTKEKVKRSLRSNRYIKIFYDFIKRKLNRSSTSGKQ